ncbi:MAG: undecaprenyl/decaprenyl-phosphate alpha-N-acetylglucosaminyl 1-phosphate transferase [Endomicrobia bacterium]|nr:undecaprenyl/decaprenyl-phosphate alpha-N-acetylglucosaminyl 1-phosphate transferase [Endomicrobiia bacterium]MDW8055445.1 MraY family glycosyltransferase [Elusimicrobiota bacterium]
MDYTLTLLISFLISVLLTPVFRKIALVFNILDYPVSDIKTHKIATPYLGGLAIAFSFFLTLFLVRLTTHFPTGTLRSLRGIIFGSIIILLLGLIDDFKYKGIHYTTKFIGEVVAAIILVQYGIKVNFITPEWFALLVTFLWIIGITNALNLIDVMDGLSSGIGIISSLGLFLISRFIEEEIYVGYASISLAGACLGFLPYNLSNRYKIFMGDTGALFLGFVLSALTLGGRYSVNNQLGVLSPLYILFVPIYETILISMLRLKRGQSPFIGSKDHFSLRLLTIGFGKSKVLIISYIISSLICCAGLIIVLSKTIAIPVILTCLLTLFIIIATRYLTKVEIQ